MILDENENRLLYLAAPYSDNDPEVEKTRFRKTCEIAAKLMANGIAVFSPLANSIPAVELGGLRISHAEFMRFDNIILRRCDELLVLALAGWRASRGVQEEIQEAMALRKPVSIVPEEDFDFLPYLKENSRIFGYSQILKYGKS